MLFRRVRDEHGQLQLSKRAAAFHPGRGVYRSSYKNARRLAVTETNMAYRTADHLRWQKMDFVVGVEVHLSNNHPCDDICDDLKGRYPKDFKFTGWHPHCRCYATTILKTPDEIMADNERILQGKEPTVHSVNAVVKENEGLIKWIKANKKRIEDAKSLPYFLSDNPLLLKIYVPEAHHRLVEQALVNARAVAKEFQGKVEAIAAKFGAIVTPVNLKSRNSALRKINTKRKDSIGTIRDLVRNTIIVNSSDSFNSIIDRIKSQFVIPYGDEGVPRIKYQSTVMGYTGYLVNVQLKGVQGEIQINTPQMIYAKDESAKVLLPKEIFEEIEKKSGLNCGLGHKYYEEWRLPTTSPERRQQLEMESRDYYDRIRNIRLVK